MTVPAGDGESKITAFGVRKIYNEGTPEAVTALDGIDLRIGAGEFTALLGPSGCGKSTFLYMVGGFEQPSAGSILVNGAPVRGPGADRGIVFQEYQLFPWLSVAENIAYGLRIAGAPPARRDGKVRELVELIGLAGFENAYPETLSGGMKQRVAIARAIACEPDILLMDEPFGALDAQTRGRMIRDLSAIHRSTGRTTLFVTHSVEEAVLLADRVVLFSARPGRVKRIFDIDIPHPRHATDARVVEKRREILAILEEELSSVT